MTDFIDEEFRKIQKIQEKNGVKVYYRMMWSLCYNRRRRRRTILGAE